ncbi:PREDICTED: tumor necrosis factor receptor superfamily member wengen [Nicrophorus vespilloides]|uniref:Tumor necrosis factor receptor superfamily member wengen n=1 Tax=Nicrophorus vespilloides TaxID=110193 RepID=A0ABM1MZI3_NICVS|nr:PREDICTED: tumor necrosis factor receptor superfamily member wengen [Nicrophorus vespilloides]
MGIFTSCKVLLAAPALTTILVLLCFPPTTVSALCLKDQYLNYELQKCMNCTICESKNQVVFIPCQVYKDTQCAPLGILLEYLNSQSKKHRHQNHRHSGVHRSEHHRHVGGESTETTMAGSAEPPFNTAEELIWDWQAIALTCAVCSCIIFFLVVALYSLYQAKQWRRLKVNYEADVEELSARLSLMASSNNEKGDPENPNLGTIDPNYLNNRCVYLEKLLHGRKDKRLGSESGNVYIDENMKT